MYFHLFKNRQSHPTLWLPACTSLLGTVRPWSNWAVRTGARVEIRNTRTPERERGYSVMTLTADARECTDQLARFFPKLPAVRIPVRVTPRRPGQTRVQEATVVEYGTKEYAIFLSKLALEFDDRVRLVRDAGGRPVEAAVIALQYHQGCKAVAVRFLDAPCEWMMQP